jgi:hypothetical protein
MGGLKKYTHTFSFCLFQASNREVMWAKLNHSSDILSIRFKHTRILRIFGLFKKYFKIFYTKANFQAFVFL